MQSFNKKNTFTKQNLHHFLPTVHQNRTERSGRGVASCREINAHIETFTPTYTYIVRRPTEGTKAWPTDYRDMCYTYNRDILYVFITLYVVYGLSWNDFERAKQSWSSIECVVFLLWKQQHSFAGNSIRNEEVYFLCIRFIFK